MFFPRSQKRALKQAKAALQAAKKRLRRKRERSGDSGASSLKKRKRKRKREASDSAKVIPAEGSPIIPAHRRVLAPMVGGSELAFRMLCRKYGVDLCYTPMMYASKFVSDASYRNKMFHTHARDRPLAVHFCGNDPDVMLAAARLVRDRCDAIDINLGCPQRIAYSGHFGAYLLDKKDHELVFSIVRRLAEDLTPSPVTSRKIPIFCKIRLLDTVQDTIEFCRGLERSGCSLIAVHARYRGTATRRRDGPAFLDQVKEIKKAVGIPVLSNGNVRSSADVAANLKTTCADGIMSAEGALDNPAIFLPHWLSEARNTTSELAPATPKPDNLDLALEYVRFTEIYPSASLNHIVFHVRRMCRKILEKYHALEELKAATSADKVVEIMKRCKRFESGNEAFEFDPARARAAKEAREKRSFEEKCRKKYVARMMRKAKREGRELQELLKPTCVPGGHVYGADPSWLTEKGM